LYKTTEYWIGEHDRSLRWNDPTVGIDWPLHGFPPLLSEKDALAPLLRDAEGYA
jgi:dTDP-4-dehydrorhamnose 3,5-epimerase